MSMPLLPVCTRIIDVKWLAFVAACSLSFAAGAQTQVLDDFHDAARWQAGGSDQVKASLHRGVRGALCLRYDFAGVSGHALLRRELPLDLPDHYVLRLRLHGLGAANALQLKFVDASGDNVWWMNRPDYVPPQVSSELTIRQRQIEFAWGPTADRVLRHAAAIELVVASGAGGRGELCFERLTLSELPAPGPRPPAMVSTSPRHWQVDLGERREINGLFVRWPAGARARDFDVQLSDDAQRWRTVRRVRGASRDLQALWLPPELEARHVRLGFQTPIAVPLDVQVMDPEQWPTRNAALATLAKALPRGRVPRGFVGEQNYWTLVGVDGGGAHAAVISEDGALEPRKRGPSLEPFVIDEVVACSAELGRRRHRARAARRLSAAAAGALVAAGCRAVDRGWCRRHARARATHRALHAGQHRRHAPTPHVGAGAAAMAGQSAGAVSQCAGRREPVRRLAWQARTLRIDGQPWLQALTPPHSVVAGALDNGDVLVDATAQQPLHTLVDEQGLANAALRWTFDLAPGESRTVAVALPLAGNAAAPAHADDDWARVRLDAVAAQWRERLNRVGLTLPADCAADGRHLAQLARAHPDVARRRGVATGHALVRARWVRDGAMMVAGLLRLGEVQAARDFVRVVFAVPVRQRQGAVLCRRARRRPGARERQPRRVHLRRRRAVAPYR